MSTDMSWTLVKPFHVLIGNLPSRLRYFSKEKQWQLLKDEMKLMSGKEEKNPKSINAKNRLHGAKCIAQRESIRTGKPVTREKVNELFDLLESWQLPKSNIDRGIAELEFDNYCFMQGHVWNECVLETWLLRKVDNGFKMLRAPVDSSTGLLRPAPVRLGKVAAAPDGKGDGLHKDLPHSCAPHALATNDHIQRRQRVPKTPLSPCRSSSSRGSSISSPPVQTTPHHRFTAIPPSVVLSNTPGSSLAFGNLDNTTRLVSANASQGYAQELTPSSSISVQSLPISSPLTVSTKYYRVTIKNLSLEATDETIGDLIEQRTRRYVPLVQPKPITFRRIKGTLHAYIKFTQEDDARNAVQSLKDLKYLGRTIHATLDIVDGQ
ncbi:hypothetical protein ACLMJK_006584 [Lecanora helva]